MSTPHFAQELLDHIVDHLHQDSEALQECSLVSKSWIPRTRKHLFANVNFTSGKFKLWKHAFPDPLSSPSHYTKSLSVYSLCATFEYEEGEAGSWIKAFRNVSSFKVYSYGEEDTPSHGEDNITLEEEDHPFDQEDHPFDQEDHPFGQEDHPFDQEDDVPFVVSLVPFHGFSLALKSLTIGIRHLPYKDVLEFISSFKLLEDLTVRGLGAQDNYEEEEDQMNLQIASAFPPLTGTFDLIPLRSHLGYTVDRLLRLPNGMHFRALRLWLIFDGDSPSERRVATIRGLIEECSPTLKDLLIVFDGEFMQYLCTLTLLTFIPSCRDLHGGRWKHEQFLPGSLQGNQPGVSDIPLMGN
jgi:hypothetical protein